MIGLTAHARSSGSSLASDCSFPVLQDAAATAVSAFAAAANLYRPRLKGNETIAQGPGWLAVCSSYPASRFHQRPKLQFHLTSDPLKRTLHPRVSQTVPVSTHNLPVTVQLPRGCLLVGLRYYFRTAADNEYLLSLPRFLSRCHSGLSRRAPLLYEL